MTADCLIGALHPDGRTVTTRLHDGGDPQRMLPVLRRIWRNTFDGDTRAMLARLLAWEWDRLDPDATQPTAGGLLVIGAGSAVEPGDEPYLGRGDLHTVGTVGCSWAYLIDTRDDQVLVYAAGVHGRWLFHSRHLLQAALDGMVPGPMPLAGDAATAAHTGHRWRATVVSLDGLHTAWYAEICTGEHARGVVVARFDPGTLDEVIDVTETFYRDRLPGSGLARLHRDGTVLVAAWYAGTPHEQTVRIFPDRGGRYVLGPHIWPWILTQEDTPGHDGTSMRNGTLPVLEWVSPAGFAACNPDLAGFPLPMICAALAVMHPGRAAVIEPADRVSGYVWLPAPGHGLMLTPLSRHPDAGTVVLPRPLGGSWSADPPVPVVTAAQVARTCALIGTRHIRLEAALAEPTLVQPDPEEQHHVQP